MNYKYFLTIGLISACVACGGTPKFGTQEYADYQEQQRQKNMAKEVEKTIDKTPSWFIQPPVENNAIYAVATDYSSDLQFAVDKAMLNAKVGLASQISNKVSSKMKEFAQETGTSRDPQLIREIEKVSTELVTEVNIPGYSISKREIMQQGTGFRAYVLLRYPLGDANKIVVEQTKKSAILDSKLRSSKAFQELEKDIADSKKE